MPHVSSLNTWQATWNNIPNLNGSYLIGVQAIDDGTRTSGGTVNRTFSYSTPAEVQQIAGQAPVGETWAANPAVTGAQSTALYLNTCGVPQPYISKAAGAAAVSAGSSVAFTLTVHNTLSTALAVNSIQDSLPPGFTFVSFDSLSLGSPSSIPSVGASGVITWTFSSPRLCAFRQHSPTRISRTHAEHPWHLQQRRHSRDRERHIGERSRAGKRRYAPSYHCQGGHF